MIDEDLVFQRRSLRVTHVAYWGMVLLVVGGALGVFGLGGPFSAGEVIATGGGLRVVYQKVVHVDTPTELVVDGGAEQWLSAEILAAAELVRVTPQPMRVEAAADGEVFVFATSGGSSQVSSRYQLRPRRAGRIEAALSGRNGPVVAWTQLVLP